jgi:hypothetical protein
MEEKMKILNHPHSQYPKTGLTPCKNLPVHTGLQAGIHEGCTPQLGCRRCNSGEEYSLCKNGKCNPPTCLSCNTPGELMACEENSIN